MSDRNPVNLIRAAVADPSAVTDAQLVTRFARERDRAAFELLLYRHGPMVNGVCRRVLGHAQDAEDSFQAVFLTLARKADTIAEGTALAGWLYRVALRAALAARKARARREARETPSFPVPEVARQDHPAADALGRELRRLIDEEVARLPDRFRIPFLLCEVQGRCRAAAAAELRCAVGTVESRLTRARQRLRRSLTRRGVAPLTVLAATAAPAALHAAAFRNAFPTATAHPSPAVAALAKAAWHPLWLSPLRKAALAITAVCLLTASAGIAMPGRSDDKPAAPEKPKAEPAAEVARSVEPPLPHEAVARVGSARLRHRGMVKAAAFSPDGKLLASADDTGEVCVWDAATGEHRHRFEGGVSYFPAIGFIDGGKALLVALTSPQGGSSAVMRYDLVTGTSEPYAPVGKRADLHRAAFDPTGKVFGFATDAERFHLLDTETGKPIGAVAIPPAGSPPVVAPGGKLVAFPLGHSTGPMPVVDVASGKTLSEVNEEGQQVRAAAFTRDCKTVGTLMSDGAKESFATWDVRTGKLIRKFGELERTATAVAFTPDDKQLYVGSSQRMWVQVFDAATGKEVRRIRAFPSVCHLAFSPDGKAVAGCRSQGTVSLWSTETGKRLPASADPEPGFYNVRFLPDGGLLTVADTAAVLDPRTGKVVKQLRDPRTVDYAGFAFSNDMRLSVESDTTGAIRLMNAETGEVLRKLEGHKHLADPIVFSADGRRLASRGYDETLRIWDVAAGKELRNIAVPGRESGRRLVLSRDGRLVATSEHRADASVVRVWDVEAGRELPTLTGPKGYVTGVAFSPDGTLLALAGGYRSQKSIPKDERPPLTVWDVATGKERFAPAGHEGPVHGVAFSPDGRTLASGGEDGSVRLWEVATGQERHVFKGHASGVGGVTFSADGRMLASSSSEAPMFVWDVYAMAGKEALALAAENRAMLWDALAAPDAADGFRAVRRLAAAGADATTLLREKVQARRVPEAKQVEALLAALDSDRFAARQKAMTELQKIAEDIEPTLRAALADARSPEARDRLAQIVGRIGTPSPDRLREMRALEVLERIGTADARKVLDELARGPSNSWLAIDAREALKRLSSGSR